MKKEEILKAFDGFVNVIGEAYGMPIFSITEADLVGVVSDLTKPQNAISAAAYLKAADICKYQERWQTGESVACAEAIRAAIPADDMQALRELLMNAYIEGFDASGEGYNAEYGANKSHEYFTVPMNKYLDEILGSAK